MSAYTSNHTNTQNELLMKNLMDFYKESDNLNKMLRVINGESRISLRIVDWFVNSKSGPWENERMRTSDYPVLD